jgi:hypothetical protein
MTCAYCEAMRRRALEAWRNYAPRPPRINRHPVKRLYEQAASERKTDHDADRPEWPDYPSR